MIVAYTLYKASFGDSIVPWCGSLRIGPFVPLLSKVLADGFQISTQARVEVSPESLAIKEKMWREACSHNSIVL